MAAADGVCGRLGGADVSDVKNAENTGNKNTKKRHKKSRRFWIGYGIYMVVLAALVAILLVNVWKTMKKYEQAQPVYVLEELLADLKAGKSDIIEDSYLGRFEQAQNYADVFADSVKGKDLEYSVKTNDDYSMVYNLIDGGEVVAEAELVSDNERTIMGILSISDWKAVSVRAKVPSGDKYVKVTVPDTYTVKINGVKLGTEDTVGEPKPLDGMDYVAEYVDVPKMVTYEVKGLLDEPQVEVSDWFDMPVDISGYTDLTDITFEYKESEMPQDYKDYVVKAAMDYSNFFSKDLPGCYEGTACIQPYFPEGSYYIDLAEQYRTGDMWMYSAHHDTQFLNVTVTEYIRYSDLCFSCRVAFDKNMVLDLSGETRTDRNDQTYYYVNIGGNWLIADIKSNV